MLREIKEQAEETGEGESQLDTWMHKSLNLHVLVTY